MNDFTIFGTKIHFDACKDDDYRQRVVEAYLSLATFLQENGLTVRDVLAPGDVPTVESKIMKSDLSDEGFELMKRALERWLRAGDRSQNPKNVGILKRELAKMRAE